MNLSQILIIFKKYEHSWNLLNFYINCKWHVETVVKIKALIILWFHSSWFCSYVFLFLRTERGCSSIVEPIRSMHEAIGPIPSTSRQQQKEWSGGASECRHVRLSQTSELPLLEHHTLSWSWSLWLGRIQGSLIRLPAFRRTDWSCAPVTLVPF